MYHFMMIGFLIKKTFFDLWDNMFRIALINLGFIAVVMVPIFLPGLFQENQALAFTALGLGLLLCSVYLAAAALSVKAVSDYGSFDFGDFVRNLKVGLPAGLIMGFVILLAVAMVSVVIPFYLAMESPLGLLLSALIFWTVVIAALALQFFFPIRARLDSNLKKAFKKSFIILIDNSRFAFFVLLHNMVIFLLSALLVFLFPGPGGILLFLDEALRLRLLKYDWLEVHPELAASPKARRNIPWDAILIDEQEKTGTRSFKNFIFPWKD